MRSCENTHPNVLAAVVRAAKHTPPDAPAAATLLPLMAQDEPAQPAAATLRDFESYVKVVDMGESDAAERFTNSLKETGFAVLTNHGLDYDLVTQVYDEWRQFFLSGQVCFCLALASESTHPRNPCTFARHINALAISCVSSHSHARAHVRAG